MSSKRSRKNRFVLFGVLASIFVVAGVAYFAGNEKTTRDKWAKIDVGMTEDRVVEILGMPRMVLGSQVELKDQYAKGWKCARQSVTGKVLVYAESMLVLYIWFDADDRVEETCIARS